MEVDTDLYNVPLTPQMACSMLKTWGKLHFLASTWNCFDFYYKRPAHVHYYADFPTLVSFFPVCPFTMPPTHPWEGGDNLLNRCFPWLFSSFRDMAEGLFTWLLQTCSDFQSWVCPLSILNWTANPGACSPTWELQCNSVDSTHVPVQWMLHIAKWHQLQRHKSTTYTQNPADLKFYMVTQRHA